MSNLRQLSRITNWTLNFNVIKVYFYHTIRINELILFKISQGFGKADHEVSVSILKKKYPDYNITWSDEGYWKYSQFLMIFFISDLYVIQFYVKLIFFNKRSLNLYNKLLVLTKNHQLKENNLTILCDLFFSLSCGYV